MSLLQDLRFGLRMIFKSPGFSAVVIVTLALGIGVNTTVFTLVNAVLIRGLPFEDPDRILFLSCNNLSKNQNRIGSSHADLLDWRAGAKRFEGLAGFQGQGAVISDGESFAERFPGSKVTANLFPLLRQQALHGRVFLPDEERPGAPPVALIGYNVWRNRYGADPALVGKTLRINEVPTLIVGVMPEGVQFPNNADVWVPLIPDASDQKRENRNLGVFGRLAAGATTADAQAELSALMKTLEKEYPASNQGVSAGLRTASEEFNGGRIRTVFLSLMGAVGFVLLIACANVANLLLARSLSRAKEMSIRSAMGASRFQVVRQLLIESVLMGLAGGLLGLPLAMWGVRTFDLAVTDSGKPAWIHFTMDYTVFGYLAAICILTGVLFGLAPALHISKLDLNENLKESGRGSSGGSRMRYLTGVMVVTEVALSLVLLAGAGLMIRSFMRVYGIDPGLDTRNVLTVRYSLPQKRYEKPESRMNFYERLAPKLAAIPGVESAALSSNLPLRGADMRQFEIEGKPPVEPDKRPRLARMVVSPEYFRMARVKVKRGREFDGSDGSPGRETILVNQSFAAKYFPGEDAVGKRIKLYRNSGEQLLLTIVGVTPDIVQLGPTSTDPNTVIYEPYRREAFNGMWIIARTGVDPGSLIDEFRAAVKSVDGDIPVADAKTLEQVISDTRWPFRVFGTLFGIFAALGLLMSAIGIYAVVAYSVERRTQEIGVRMALGASPKSVIRLVLRRGIAQLAVGLALGIAAAYGATRALKDMLVQTSPTDPGTFAVTAILLLAVGVAACWLPARRAAGIDPLVALRHE